jgi:hypothetical protein
MPPPDPLHHHTRALPTNTTTATSINTTRALLRDSSSRHQAVAVPRKLAPSRPHPNRSRSHTTALLLSTRASSRAASGRRPPPTPPPSTRALLQHRTCRTPAATSGSSSSGEEVHHRRRRRALRAHGRRDRRGRRTPKTTLTCEFTALLLALLSPRLVARFFLLLLFLNFHTSSSDSPKFHNLFF